MRSAASLARRPVSARMRACGARLAFGAGVFLHLFAATPARAELLVCNQSLDVLNIALGFGEAGEFHTEGWWSVGANRCSSVVKVPLSNRYYYIYVEDVFGQAVLSGEVPACVDEKRFSVVGVADCWLRGLREVPFAEVDTMSQFRWTVLLRGQD